MSDVDQLAAAARVSAFATAAAVAGRAAPGTVGLAELWVRRAALAHQWPAVHADLVGPVDADLVAAARRAAERCREHRTGLLGKAANLFKRGTDPVPLLAECGALLDRMADALATPGGLAGGLAAVVAECAAGTAAARLLDLQNQLAERSASARGLLDRLAADGASWPDSTASDATNAAVETVRRVVADLAARTGEERVWELVCAWVEDWFAAFGVRGKLLVGAPPAVGDEVFALRHSPDRAIVLRVEPGAASQRVPPPVRKKEDAAPSGSSWANLPPVPAWPGLTPAPLVEWVAEVQATAKRSRAQPSDAVARERFGKWLATAPGRDWFARWLAAAEREPSGPAARWWRVVRAAGWCRAHPDLNLDANPTRVWPTDTPVRWPSCESTAGEGPAGNVVEVRTYAPVSDAARVVLSDGLTEPGSALARFHALYDAVGAVESWWGEGRWEESRALSLEAAPDPDRAAAVIGKWLDLFGGEQSDGAVGMAVREWASVFGLALIAAPADGTIDPDIHTTTAVFSDVPAGRLVRVTGYGLRGHGRVYRPCAVEVSLGPPPAGLVELEEAAAHLPEVDPLRTRVTGLREALRGDYLREAALELYLDYWAEAGRPVRTAVSGAGREFGPRLMEFLQAACGLSEFVPQSVHDHPDGWLAVVPGGRAVTGLVRRVHRPGLQDEQGNLRIPALVEVE